MGKALTDFGLQVAQSGIGAGMGLLLGGINDRRQLQQQQDLQNLQIKGSKELTDYQYQKQLEMWKATNFSAQKEQLKMAGLNPGLIYGMGGAGGTTTGSGGAGVSGANAPVGGREVQDAMGMGMQLQLLKAQKDNIEADTANKKAQEKDLIASAEGRGLENAFTAWMQGTTPEGEDVGGDMQKSTRGQKEVTDVERTKAETQFKLDENDRQKLMNNKVMEEIGAKISLMAKQGQSQEQIYKNLVKEGLLLDAEIEWNKLDISGGNVGKFITNIIKMAFKPR